jgi:hypothetical protein
MLSTRRSFRSLIAALAVAAFSVVATTYDDYVAPLARSIARGWALGWDWVIGRLAAVSAALPAPLSTIPQVLPRHMIAMRDYVQRQTRLQRARLLPQWRMAPSI